MLTTFVRRLATFAGVLALFGALTPLASGATAPAAALTPAKTLLTGVPQGVSLLFAIEFGSGTLRPDRHSGANTYTLTLAHVSQMGTWFSDRPQRDAGRVSIAQLFRAWRALGFVTVAPNAAVVVDHASSERSAMAMVLHLRAYSSRTDTATFTVRELGALSHGLKSINRRLSTRLDPHFSGGAMFIDNGIYEDTCTLGQPQLMDYPEAAGNDGLILAGFTPANGQVLPIADYPSLFALYGTTFGGNGTTTFGVPDMTAPAGTGWFICASGLTPTTAYMGPCSTGQVSDLFVPGGTTADVTDPNWLPADGQTVAASAVPRYALALGTNQTQITLPDVTAPPGMRAYVCVAVEPSDPSISIGQIDEFAGDPLVEQAWSGFEDSGADWLSAAGESLSIYSYSNLFSVNTYFYSSETTFNAPDIPATTSGLTWWVASGGLWPLVG